MKPGVQVAVYVTTAIFAVSAVIVLAVLVINFRQPRTPPPPPSASPVVAQDEPEHDAPPERVLALVHSPWCKHCKKLVPVFEQFASQGYSVRLVDGSQKDISWFRANKVFRYPTVCVMTEDTVQEQYPSSAPRTKAGILEFGQSVGVF